MAKGQRNGTPHFWPVITPLEKISICKAHPIRLFVFVVAMGDRAHFSRPYMESGDDDEGGKRKMMMSKPLQNAVRRAQMCGVVSSPDSAAAYYGWLATLQILTFMKSDVELRHLHTPDDFASSTPPCCSSEVAEEEIPSKFLPNPKVARFTFRVAQASRIEIERPLSPSFVRPSVKFVPRRLERREIGLG